MQGISWKIKVVYISFPNFISDDYNSDLMPPICLKVKIDGLIAESRKIAYRYLRWFLKIKSDIEIKILSEHKKDYKGLLAPIIKKKEKWALISDSGLPCISDPGSKLVDLANKHQIKVEVFMGAVQYNHGFDVIRVK